MRVLSDSRSLREKGNKKKKLKLIYPHKRKSTAAMGGKISQFKTD